MSNLANDAITGCRYFWRNIATGEYREGEATDEWRVKGGKRARRFIKVKTIVPYKEKPTYRVWIPAKDSGGLVGEFFAAASKRCDKVLRVGESV